MNSPPLPRWIAWGGILVVAAVLRMHQLTGPSLWYDEAAIWKTILFSWDAMLQSIQRNVHPPVYYVLLKLWAKLCGTSVESLRGFSVLCGVATVGLIGLIVREAAQPDEIECEHPDNAPLPSGAEGASLLAATLYAINPIAIEQSQQARMYALGIFFAAILGWGTLRVLKSPRRWSGWVLVILAGNLLPLTHYYGLLTSLMVAAVILLKAVVLWTQQPDFRRSLITRFAAAGTVTVPIWVCWGPILLAQHARVQADYWIPPLTKWELVFICAEWVSSPFVRHGGLLVSGCMFALWMVGAGCLLVSKSPTRWALAALALGPPLLSTLYSLATRNLLQGRYWSFAQLFFVVGIVVAVQGIPTLWMRRGLALLLLGASLLWVVQDRRERQNLTFASGLKGVGELLRDHIQPGEIVVVASPFFHPSIQYDVGRTNEVYVADSGTPLTHFQGSAILQPDEIIPLSNTLTSKAQKIWLVTDDSQSHTLHDPSKLPLPRSWRLLQTTPFYEGNRLPSHLEVREYGR